MPGRQAGPNIGDVVRRSIIIAYKEDVSLLENELEKQGLNPTVQRGEYTEEQSAYPAQIRCFINHYHAWVKAAECDGYTVICESDFVPCSNLHSMSVFWPLNSNKSWGYLYQGSPRVLHLDVKSKYIRNHCAPLVCYVVNNHVATKLLEYYEHEMYIHDPRKYFSFEAHLQWWLMGRDHWAYMPIHSYGEHGGVANPEHGQLAGAARGGAHRADRLAGPLAFLPQYAQGSPYRFVKERVHYNLLGWARLFGGRWVITSDKYDVDLKMKVKMFALGIKRLLS